jgi:hypothetical protein
MARDGLLPGVAAKAPVLLREEEDDVPASLNERPARAAQSLPEPVRDDTSNEASGSCYALFCAGPATVDTRPAPDEWVLVGCRRPWQGSTYSPGWLGLAPPLARCSS